MARPKLVTDGSVWTSIGVVGRRPRGASGVAAEIADQIERLILSERIGEGTRLPSERDLAQMLAVSRPMVSQAIRILVTRGLVDSRRGSGAYVRRQPDPGIAASVSHMLKLDQESVTHLNELRLWLENTGVVLAIERSHDDEIRQGEAALRELADAAGRPADWISADTRFHATLVRAGGNPFLSSIYEGVHACLINYEYRGWIDTGTIPQWLEATEAESLTALHAAILTAIRDRDPEAARRAIRRHHDVMSEHLRYSREVRPSSRRAKR